MQSDDPSFLPVGTEVSAKFKGAFCEAKVKKITKSFKCKVNLKEPPFGVVVVEDSAIKSSPIELNQIVEVQQGKQLLKGIIQHIKDCSTYHVVFNDGDEKTLKRTQMCLKGAKHFDSAVNLDALPLYNPEQFSSPVVKGSLKKKKRKTDDSSPLKRKKRKEDEDDSEDEGEKKREKRAAASAATVAIGEMDHGDTEVSCDGSTTSGETSDVDKEKEKERKRKEEEKKEKTAKSEAKKTTEHVPGDVLCVYEEETLKGKWFPAVVIDSKHYKKAFPKAKVLSKKDLPVRSFQSGKITVRLVTNVASFADQNISKKFLESCSNSLKIGIERAQSFSEKGTLPPQWLKAEIFAHSTPTKPKKEKDEKEKPEVKEKESPKKKEKEKEKSEKPVEKKEKDKEKEKEKEKKAKSPVSESSSSEESDEEEYGEERDLFVAQLYKFQEERGTPINRAPILGGKDIDLYRFYKVVQHYGGAKKATSHGRWKKILCRLKLEGCPGATPVTVRKAYQRYLSHFNSFYKRLGWSLDESPCTSSSVTRPRERRLIRNTTEDKSKLKRRKSTTTDGKPKSKEEDDKEDSVKDAGSVKSRKDDETSVSGRLASKENSVDTDQKPVETSDVSPESKSSKSKTQEPESSIASSGLEEEVVEEENVSTIMSPKSEPSLPDKESRVSECKSERSDRSDFKREKKEVTDTEDESEGGKRKRRRPSMKERMPIKGEADDLSKDYLEGYNQADIFSNFYLGQKVRAQHHGRWYDARVVNMQQPLTKEIVDIIANKEGDSDEPTPDTVIAIHKAMVSTKCLVHYLGWNSRYDEWISLNKMRVSVKDEETSLKKLRDEGKNRITEGRISWIAKWCTSPSGVESLVQEETSSPNMFIMGGYRPRRVSISQYEQLNAAAEGLKKDSSKSSPAAKRLTSPASSIRQVVKKEKDDNSSCDERERSTPQAKKEEVPRVPPPVKNTPAEVPVSPIRESRRRRTTSRSIDSPIITPSITPVTTPAPGPHTRSVSPLKRSQTPQTPSLSTEPSSSLTDETPLASSTTDEKPEMDPVVEELPTVEVDIVAEFEAVEEKVSTEQVVDVPNNVEAEQPQCVESEREPSVKEEEEVKEKSPEKPIEQEEVQPETTVVVEEKIEEEVKEEETIQIEETEQTVTITEESIVIEETTVVEEVVEEEPEEVAPPRLEMPKARLNVTLIKQDIEERHEENNTPYMSNNEDFMSDGGESGSETPHRTDDDCSPSVDPGSGSRVFSPSRGRGLKRKRNISRHSHMVVERKYIKVKPKDKPDEKHFDGSDEEDEEENTTARVTYNKQKNQMLKLMEQEQSLENFDLLDMICITKINEPDYEKMIELCEQRMIILRDVFESSKRSIIRNSKRWKTQTEKKKERERLSRDALSSPHLPSVEQTVPSCSTPSDTNS